MKRGLSRLLLWVSWAAMLVTAVLCVRSFFVTDQWYWSRVTERPLTSEGRAWAEARGFTVHFMSHTDAIQVSTWRGRVTFFNGLEIQPFSTWEPSFKESYVNRSRYGYAPSKRDGVFLRNGGFWDRIGFDDVAIPGAPGSFISTRRYRTIPLWLITLLSAVYPFATTRRWVRLRHRRRLGLCLICGYDLRGSAGRCPECGAVREGASDLATGTAVEPPHPLT